jgi:hypothetical protein
VISGEQGKAQRVCQFFQSHLEKWNHSAVELKFVNAATRAAACPLAYLRGASSERREGSPERRALSCVGEDCFGSHWIRCPENGDACCVDWNRKGLAPDREGVARGRKGLAEDRKGIRGLSTLYGRKRSRWDWIGPLGRRYGPLFGRKAFLWRRTARLCGGFTFLRPMKCFL